MGILGCTFLAGGIYTFERRYVPSCVMSRRLCARGRNYEGEKTGKERGIRVPQKSGKYLKRFDCLLNVLSNGLRLRSRFLFVVDDALLFG